MDIGTVTDCASWYVFQYSDWPCIIVCISVQWLTMHHSMYIGTVTDRASWYVYRYSDWPCIMVCISVQWLTLHHGMYISTVTNRASWCVYQYSETNVMQFLFSLLRIKGLYTFRALLAQPQEALHKMQLVYCVRVMSVGCTRVCTANWHNMNAIYQMLFVERLLRWASNARNM
jgi:hypothetical protein